MDWADPDKQLWRTGERDAPLLQKLRPGKEEGWCQARNHSCHFLVKLDMLG